MSNAFLATTIGIYRATYRIQRHGPKGMKDGIQAGDMFASETGISVAGLMPIKVTKNESLKSRKAMTMKATHNYIFATWEMSGPSSRN